MKKTLFGLTVVVALIVASCGAKVSNPLIGKWKLTNIDIPKVDLTSNMETNIDSAGITGVDTAVKAMTKGMEDMTNAMTGMGEALANSFLKGSIYNFKDDGTVEVTVLFATQKGDYKVSPDNKTVETTLEGKTESFNVESVTDTELKLSKSTGEMWIFAKK